MAENTQAPYIHEVVPRHRYNAVLIGAEGKPGRLFQQQVLGHENWWPRIQLLQHMTTLADWQTAYHAYEAAAKQDGLRQTAGRSSAQETLLGSTQLFFVDDTAPESAAGATLSGIEVIKRLEEMKIARPLGRLLTASACSPGGIIIGCARQPSEAFSDLLGDSNLVLESDTALVAADEVLENALRLLPGHPISTP